MGEEGNGEEKGELRGRDEGEGRREMGEEGKGRGGEG